tara:strand:+ start:22 stop:2439 length:2418 start_codon:yes stop_codon:yes gene_type:complete
MKTILIDGHSIAFRAFFALGDLKTKKDFPTSVIHGFTMMLKKVVEDYNPDQLIIAWDVSRNTFRTKLYKDYKANRSSSPDSFKIQIPELKKIITGFNIAQVSKENYEADDVLGTLAKKMSSKQNKVYILTGDRDSFQLIDQNINIIYTKKGISETEIIDEKIFKSKYGIEVDQYIEYLALKGDTSDNIPGVPGIGEKTALELLKKYKDIEGIYNHLEELKPKQKENLSNNIKQVSLSKELATIVTDLDIEESYSGLDNSIFKDKNNLEKNIEILEEFELNTFLKGVKKEKNTTTVQDFSKTKDIKPNAWLGIADESILVMQENELFKYQEGNKHLLESLNKLNGKFNLVSSNFYYKLLLKEKNDIPTPNFSLDLATYILNSNSKPDSYEKISKYYKLNVHKRTNDEEFDPNLVEILKNINQISESVFKQFSSGLNKKVYKTIDAPILPVLVKMSLSGIKIDKNKIQNLSKIVSKQIATISLKIYEQSGIEFNLNSPKQLSEILYEKLDLPVLKKTPKGAPSTDASVLDELSKKHDIAKYLLEYREIEKIRSTYIDGLSSDIVNGKVHSNFNLYGTSTGRLSSEKPNLQNIPTKTDLGRKIKEFFIAPAGKSFVLADYSQIELRVLAHMSKDSSMKKILSEREKDIHMETASRIFNVNLEEVSYEMRRKAKEINFGLLYGMESYGLSKNLGITKKEADTLIDSYFVQFPKVKEYLGEIVSSAKDTGYTETVYGRKRYIPELLSQNKQIFSVGKRMAMNAPIQGTASDIVKLAMIEIDKVLGSKFTDAFLVYKYMTKLLLNVIKRMN